MSVAEVVDGDTIKVRLGATNETIRIIGIDTPEVVDPREPVQCFWARSVVLKPPARGTMTLIQSRPMFLPNCG
ncbi:MAG: hypothetical protein M1358_23210 [Chloroflexi bacterium]|nr:hypothetical protein [Chloroflexota bacterium]